MFLNPFVGLNEVAKKTSVGLRIDSDNISGQPLGHRP